MRRAAVHGLERIARWDSEVPAHQSGVDTEIQTDINMSCPEYPTNVAMRWDRSDLATSRQRQRPRWARSVLGIYLSTNAAGASGCRA